MIALRLIQGLPRPVSVLSASADVERRWAALLDAETAWRNTQVGDTSALFATRDQWVRAIGEYEAARVKLAEAVRRSQGRSGLRVLVGGKS